MRKFIMLTILGGAFAWLGTGAAHAQGNSNVATLAAKNLHNQMLPDQYDAWKRSATRGNEVGPNQLLQTVTASGYTTHTVLLGYNLTDANDAVAFENKILAQPGVSSVVADHTSNKVVVMVKEEDEHDALKTYFGIE